MYVLNLLGTSFVKSVNGIFCRLCKKYQNADLLDEHVRSKPHYEKFAEAVGKKKKEALEKKEEAEKKKAELENSSIDDAAVKVNLEIASCFIMNILLSLILLDSRIESYTG